MHNIVMCMNQSDSIVIIPTYNEKENVENIIRAVFALEKCFHILIIDDGSPDGTASIVKRLQSEEFADRLFLIERQGKLGLGTAYITGLKGEIYFESISKKTDNSSIVCNCSYLPIIHEWL